MLQPLMLPVADNDHVMVLIYLGGGNDGLNTVVPLDQMSALAAARLIFVYLTLKPSN